MKKNVLLLALFFTSITQTIDQYTNQTFMFPKEVFGSYGMEQSSWHNIVYNKHSHGVALQAFAYGQTSFTDATASQYFLFDGLDQLVVQNDPTGATFATETFTRNILGAWFGIDGSTPFTGTFSLTPQQTQYGITLGFSQDLSNYFKVAFLRNASFNFSVPVVHIKNQLVFNGDTTILNALQGNNAMSMNLDEPWQYLVVNDQVQEATKMTNAKFQVATKYESEDDVQVATTTFLIFPFVESVSNEILFEPAFGYNGHIAWGSGITFQFPLLRSQDRLSRICFFTGLENKFLFSNNQQRTVELTGAPYSRYMPLYDRYTDKMVPGVNVFTRDCIVEPYNLINFIAGLRYKHKDSIGEIGYELWGHDTEKITIDNSNLWQDNRYGIANINGDGILDVTDSGIKTASGSTMNYVVPDTVNTYIAARDLNMFTAAARAALIHRAYMSLGYGKKTETTDLFLNLGLFMEIVQNNAAFSNWGGWAKAGITF